MTDAYVNINVVKEHIKTLYTDLSLLREKIDLLEEKETDPEAFEKLVKLGGKIKEKTGGLSTKTIIDDVRG